MVAERLRGCLGPGDLAARLGGDEFAVLVPQVADEGEAVALGERLAAILRTPVTVSGREVLARASVGVRLARGGDEDPERLLRDADMAMYAAKTAGRAGVRVFDTAMHTRAVQRLDFEAALRRAVIRQQFTVRYQPVVELPGGKLAGLEALVRWDHPERGLVMPGEFVSLAEDTGLIVPIGRWVCTPPARRPATGSAASPSSPTRSSASTCRCASSSSPTCSRTWPAPSTPPASTPTS